MDHGRGRHRKRRRGWVSRVRWTVGAALEAILGVQKPPPPLRPRPVKKKPPLRVAAPPTALVREEEPEWVRRYDRAHREHTERAQHLYEPQVTPKQLPRFGWCEDEAGGRSVRPYLVAHEQRHRVRQGAPQVPQNHQSSSPAPSLPTKTSEAPAPGEWDELAGLVRQWEALRQTVA